MRRGTDSLAVRLATELRDRSVTAGVRLPARGRTVLTLEAP